MSKQFWVGVDIGKSTVVAALADLPGAQPWSRLPWKEFAHTSQGVTLLVAWVQENCDGLDNVAGVCVESTGQYSSRLSTLLNHRLGEVATVNPARPKAFGKSLGIQSKTDRCDACILALFGVHHRPVARALPSGLHKELRELSNLLDALEKERRAHENRLAEPICSAYVRKHYRQLIAALARRIKKVTAQIDAVIDQDETYRSDAKRMMTIPGVGPKTVRVVLAYFGDLRTYARDELVALAGLYPRQYESGTSVYKKPKLVRAGRGRPRTALYMAALSARKHNPQMKAFAQRLKNNTKANKAILGAVARKLLLLMRSLLINEQDYSPDYQHQVQSKTA